MSAMLRSVCRYCDLIIEVEADLFNEDCECYWNDIAGMEGAHCEDGSAHRPIEEITDGPDDGVRTLTLSRDARAIIAGLIAPSPESDPEHGVDSEGVMGSEEVWEEIRAAFPVAQFWEWAREREFTDESGEVVETVDSEGNGYIAGFGE